MRPLFLILLLISLLSVKNVLSQNPLYYHGTIVQVEGGPSFLNHQPLNTVMEDSGYQAFSNTSWGFGFGMERFSGAWVIGANLYFLMRQAPGQQQNVIKLGILNYYYGFFKVGYLAFRKETRGLPFMIYPTVGVGVGHTFLRTSPTGLAQYNRYNGTGVLVEGALNIAQFAEIRSSDKYSVKIGGSVGYIYNLGGSQSLNTLVEGEQIPVSPQGFYVRINLGMGSLRR